MAASHKLRNLEGHVEEGQTYKWNLKKLGTTQLRISTPRQGSTNFRGRKFFKRLRIFKAPRKVKTLEYVEKGC